MIRVILTAIGFLLAPIAWIINVLPMRQEFIREAYRPCFDPEVAIATNEAYYKKSPPLSTSTPFELREML